MLKIQKFSLPSWKNAAFMTCNIQNHRGLLISERSSKKCISLIIEKKQQKEPLHLGFVVVLVYHCELVDCFNKGTISPILQRSHKSKTNNQTKKKEKRVLLGLALEISNKRAE